jgi:shikimate dehydrogenase
VKAGALAQRLAAHAPGVVSYAAAPDWAGVGIAINATPMGLQPADPLPFDPMALAAGTLVADIIMKPAETRLLTVAALLGLPTHPGLPMLIEQADLYWRFFGLPDAA